MGSVKNFVAGACNRPVSSNRPAARHGEKNLTYDGVNSLESRLSSNPDLLPLKLCPILCPISIKTGSNWQ